MPKDLAQPGLDAWQATLRDGDEEAFHRLVDRYVDVLLRAARYDLEFYIAQGYLQDGDLTPEEVVGETQLYAWQHRDRCPERMSLRGWLLGVQHRRLRQMVEQERNYRHDKAISLDEEVPVNYDSWDSQEAFWDWAQPDAGEHHVELWENVVPSVSPIDIEIDLEKDGREALLGLDDTARHVLLMHDEFEVDLPEVAFIMGRGVNEVAELIELARASLYERMGLGPQPQIAEDDEPTPPPGTDE